MVFDVRPGPRKYGIPRVNFEVDFRGLDFPGLVRYRDGGTLTVGRWRFHFLGRSRYESLPEED